jgi:hypothetical protein
MAGQRRIEAGIPPILWSTINEAFDEINANFTELYFSLGNEDLVDLRNLASDLIPRSTEQFDLGAANKRWKDLYLSGNSLYLGNAVITSIDGKVNLPEGSTIGDLRIDENYFKFIAVSGQSTIEADQGTDTLNLSSGTGMSITSNISTDTITFTNSGIITAQGGTGISTSGTNPLIINNTGVIEVRGTVNQIGVSSTGSNGTGIVTISNLGVIRLQTDVGSGIGLSANSGTIQITNTLPNIIQPVVRNIAVSGSPPQATLTSDNANYTITFVPGSGTGITTNAGARTVTFANTGVRSLSSVHPSIVLSGSTGELTVGFNNRVDIIGSVFSDDSSKLVDGAVGVLRGTHIGNLVGDSDGIHTGSVYADNGTTLLVDGTTATIPWTVLADIPTEGKTIYVNTNGNNSNSGLTKEKAYRTVKYALSQALSGDTIIISSGVYEEEFPLTIPAGVSVKGTNVKSTVIKPSSGTNNKDGFLLNGESSIEDLTIKDMFYNTGDNTGYAFRFANSCSITSSVPLIQKVLVYNKGPTTTVGDPYGFLSSGAGRGAYLDGSVVIRSSLEASVEFKECIFIVPNSKGLIVTNGARSILHSCYFYFADLAIEGIQGASGRAGDGKTYFSFRNVSGTWTAPTTVSYYDVDGTTVLASGTLESIAGQRYVFDGDVSGFEYSDIRDTKVISVKGNAAVSSSQANFGSSSLALDGTGDYLELESSEDFNFGTGNFTLECWVYRSNASSTEYIFDHRVRPNDVAPVLYLSGGNLIYYTAGSNRITGTGSVGSPNAWFHVAVSRNSGITKLFVDGLQVGSSYTDANQYIRSPMTVGSDYKGTNSFSGFIDEVRITKGYSRYNSNFASILNPFVGDKYTKLLLHFDTSIIDDNTINYDIRAGSGGTSTGVLRYDRSEFGAEIYSESGAIWYGTSGVRADGEGVIIRLGSHEFGFLGTGADLTNNGDAIDRNSETLLANGGRIFNDSFHLNTQRLGNIAQVNLRRNRIEFNGGDIVLSQNIITSASGSDVSIDPGEGGILDIDADTVISGNLTVISKIPGTSKGSAEDLAGTVAFDDSYIYYCTADYTDGVADIWKRTAHGAGTW